MVKISCTVKLGDKEPFDKEQIIVKELITDYHVGPLRRASRSKRTCFGDPVPFFLDSSLGIPVIASWYFG